MLNPDYRDMLFALSEERADFLIVGAFALAAYGYPRATGHIDVWIRSTPENAARVWRALLAFGAPSLGLSQDDLATTDIVFRIGVAPRRIDIVTAIDGVEFDDAWAHRQLLEIEGRAIATLSREHLLANKRAAGRPKDLADVAWLESSSNEGLPRADRP